MKLKVLFSLFGILLSSCAVWDCMDGNSNQASNQPNTSTILGATFYDASCKKPCWLGIEAGVSDREIVETTLDEAGLDYIPNGLYTYNIFLDNVSSPLWQTVSFPAADIHLFDEDIVGIMTFVIDLCSSSILNTYGYPEIVENESTFDLLYPHFGLNFLLSIETQRVYAIFLYPRDYIDQHFPLSERKDGTDFKDLFSAPCIDALAGN